MQEALRQTLQPSEYGKSGEKFARRRREPLGGLRHPPPENFEILRFERAISSVLGRLLLSRRFGKLFFIFMIRVKIM